MDWQALLKTIAPWIGTAIGGPLGGLAVEAAAKALGVSDRTADAVKQALGGATPDQMLALKQADQAFAVQMQSLGFKNVETLAALDVDDRKSARELAIQTRSLVPAILSTIVTVGFFSVLGLMLSDIWHPKDNQALLLLLGSLSAAFGAVMNFWFGSSESSRRKDAILASSK